MAPEKTTDMAAQVELGAYQQSGSDELSWWKQPNLRRLYLMLPFLFLGSTTLGYDGSLLNGLQSMGSWQDCKLFYFFLQPYYQVNSYPSLQSPCWLNARNLRCNAWIWRSGCPDVRTLHRRQPRTKKWNCNRLPVCYPRSITPSLPTCFEPSTYVPGWSVLHWVWW